jgi:hypothetical protein
MSIYQYHKEKPKIFTEKGQVDFLKTRDKVRELLELAGAFRITKVTVSGDGWLAMAYVDRLVELGEIKELTRSDVSGQDRVFTGTTRT